MKPFVYLKFLTVSRSFSVIFLLLSFSFNYDSVLKIMRRAFEIWKVIRSLDGYYDDFTAQKQNNEKQKKLCFSENC